MKFDILLGFVGNLLVNGVIKLFEIFEIWNLFNKNKFLVILRLILMLNEFIFDLMLL